MRTLYWASAVVLNFVVVAVFAPSVWASDVTPGIRAVGAVVSVLFAAVSAVLLIARFRAVSPRLALTMKVLCCAIPVLSLVGSFDHGIVSGLELLSVCFAAVYAWATWRAFLIYAPKPAR